MLLRLWRSTFGLVALVALGFAVATIAIGAIAYEITHEALEEQLDHRIAVETAMLLAEHRENGLDGLALAIEGREASRSTASVEYLLVDPAGRRMAGGIAAQLPVKDGYQELLPYRRGGQDGVAQSIATSVPGARFVVAADRGGLKEIDALLMTLYGGGLAAMLLAGVAAAAIIGGITRRRLARIDATALAIIGGHLDQRVPRDGSGSEFDRLARTLNHMLDRMSGLMDNLRQVSSDVAHDLRTPLTRLHNRLDRALEAVDQGEQMKEIEAARHQALELLEIFASLLRIAEVEGMAERLPRHPLDLSGLLLSMAETYLPDMEASGRGFTVDVEPGLTTSGDRRLLSQAIANLLDNALRHTPEGTVVTLFGARRGKMIELGVRDDAPSCAFANPEQLFRRFIRSEGARSTPGHGLGLALVAAVAAAHGGTAEIQTGEGFEVRLRLAAVVDRGLP